MIFAELAAQRAAPLEEVIKRCLRWWRVTQETITDLAAELRLSRHRPPTWDPGWFDAFRRVNDLMAFLGTPRTSDEVATYMGVS
jgi:hypothetical protein